MTNAINYTRTHWNKGDVLTAEKLNNIENVLTSAVQKINGTVTDQNGNTTELDPSEQIASKADITTAVNNLNTENQSGTTIQTITNIKETHGKVIATYSDIAKTSTSAYGIMKVGNNLSVNEGTVSLANSITGLNALNDLVISQSDTNDANGNYKLQIKSTTGNNYQINHYDSAANSTFNYISMGLQNNTIEIGTQERDSSSEFGERSINTTIGELTVNRTTTLTGDTTIGSLLKITGNASASDSELKGGNIHLIPNPATSVTNIIKDVYFEMRNTELNLFVTNNNDLSRTLFKINFSDNTDNDTITFGKEKITQQGSTALLDSQGTFNIDTRVINLGVRLLSTTSGVTRTRSTINLRGDVQIGSASFNTNNNIYGTTHLFNETTIDNLNATFNTTNINNEFKLIQASTPYIFSTSIGYDDNGYLSIKRYTTVNETTTENNISLFDGNTIYLYTPIQISSYGDNNNLVETIQVPRNNDTPLIIRKLTNEGNEYISGSIISDGNVQASALIADVVEPKNNQLQIRHAEQITETNNSQVARLEYGSYFQLGGVSTNNFVKLNVYNKGYRISGDANPSSGSYLDIKFTFDSGITFTQHNYSALQQDTTVTLTVEDLEALYELIHPTT